MNIYQKLKFVVLMGAVLTATVLMGCSGKSEEDTKPADNAAGATGSMPTTSQMPPDAKARMDQAQAENKARADAQGKAMMQNQQGAAPK